VFNGWPHFDIKCDPLDHWKWKFKDNPSKSSLISIGVTDDKIISCSHRITTRLKIGDSVLLCSSVLDSAVHPNFRKMGIYTKMDEMGREFMTKSGIKYSFRITGNPILVKHHSKYRNLFQHITFEYIWIQDIDWHLQMMHTRSAGLYKYGFRLIKLVNRFRNTYALPASSDHDFRIKEITSFDDAINQFWNKIKDHYTFIVERNKDYLNWRYCDSRGGNYVVKVAEIGGQELGYIVLRVNKYRENYPVGYIVDLCTLPDRLDVANALVRDAVQYFDDRNVNVIRCQVIKNHPYEKIFKRYGFLNKRHRIHVFCIPHATISDELIKLQTNSPNKAHFVYGDYDEI